MKALSGKVVSAKMKNTAVVEVVRFEAHPMYRKRIRKTKKYHAHTENPVEVGAVVKIIECSPISKTKSWKVINKINKNATT